MRIIEINSLDEVFNKNNLSIMLGDFDGMHKGHQVLLNTLLNIKAHHAMLTFYPHPKEFFTSEKFKYLDTIKDKEIRLCNDLDYLIVLKTNKNILNSSKQDFINFLKNNNVTDVVCGNDFTFGKNKEGNVSDLNMFNVHLVDDVTLNNKRISSTSIREYLRKGQIKEANCLLDRIYSVKGIVSKGSQLGRTIGFPTANLDDLDYLLPGRGVYFGYALIDNIKYFGMINIGINPTFNLLKNNRLEINIFEFNNNLYDKEIEVFFIDKIRDEKKFNSKEELVLELEKNRLECLEYMNSIKSQ